MKLNSGQSRSNWEGLIFGFLEMAFNMQCYD